MRVDPALVIALALTFRSALRRPPRFEARFILQPRNKHVHSSSNRRAAGRRSVRGLVFAKRRAPRRRCPARKARASHSRRRLERAVPGRRLARFPDCKPIAFRRRRGRLSVCGRPSSTTGGSRRCCASAPRRGGLDGGRAALERGRGHPPAPGQPEEKTEPFARPVLAALPPGRDRERTRATRRAARRQTIQPPRLDASDACAAPSGGRILLLSTATPTAWGSCDLRR